MAFVKIYNAPALCKKEILRYAGCKAESDLPEGLLENCIDEAASVLGFKVCYTVFDVKTTDHRCGFSSFSVTSKTLAGNIKDCDKAVLFAATVGVGIDRLISKYSAVSPVKAVIFQAIGAERIEALCDMFCSDIQKETGRFTRPRLSPGYGDFDLDCQVDIFRTLNCQKLIGLSLTDSMMMSPSKSVTAVMGLADKPQGEEYNKCRACQNKNCLYRGEL